MKGEFRNEAVKPEVWLEMYLVRYQIRYRAQFDDFKSMVNTRVWDPGLHSVVLNSITCFLSAAVLTGFSLFPKSLHWFALFFLLKFDMNIYVYKLLPCESLPMSWSFPFINALSCSQIILSFLTYLWNPSSPWTPLSGINPVIFHCFCLCGKQLFSSYKVMHVKWYIYVTVYT